MKIIILSDSHTNTSLLHGILTKERGYDAIIHLGDGAADLYDLPELTGYIPVYQIKGNCDFSSYNFPLRLISYFEDIKFYACHGHTHNVKTGLSNLFFAAKEAECSLVLFGHTHIPFDEVSDGIRFFNPGSAAMGRYGVLEVKKADFTITGKIY